MKTEPILSSIFKKLPGVRAAVIVNPYEISAERGMYDGSMTRTKISSILPDVLRNIKLTHLRIKEDLELNGVLINTKNYYIYIRQIPGTEDYLAIFISKIIELQRLREFTDSVIESLKKSGENQ